MAIGPDDVIALFRRIDVVDAEFSIADSEYALPSENYLVNDFCPFYRQELQRMGIEGWSVKSDCDDYAWYFYTQIRWAHYRSKASMAEGIAVGVVYFMSGARAEDGSGGGHAINFAIVGERADRKLIFIEPQFAATGQYPIIKLNTFEAKSIWFVNM